MKTMRRAVQHLYACLLLFGVYLVDSQYTNEGSCQEITASMCSTMPYNRTFLPNRFGQSNVDSIALEIHQFFPLIKVQCSTAIRNFLCSTYFPECSPRGGGIESCAGLCRQSRAGCEPLMNKFGFQWPASLDCDSFSESYRCYDG